MIEPVDRRAAPAPAPATEPDPSLLPAILDAVADGVSVQDQSGSVVYANATALAMIGFETLDELRAATQGEILSRFELLDQHGNAMSPADLPGRLALEGMDPPPTVVGYRVVATGAILWAQVRATPLLAPDGRVTHAINTFRDVTDQVRVEADLRASEASYRRLVEAMPQVAWTTDGNGRLLMVNERWREYAGSEPEPGERAQTDDAVHPDDRERMERRWEASLESGDPLEATARIRRRDGAYRWHLIRAVPVHGRDGEVGAWIGTSTDIDDERRAQRASSLLAEAAERLDESLDPLETARAAAAIAVPVLGDVCAIDLLDADGRARRAATAGDIPGGADGGGLDSADGQAIAGDIREGTVVVDDPGDLAAFSGASRDGTGGALGSSIAVPLVARERTLGVLRLASRERGRYGRDEIALAEELGHRVALALSNADLYAGALDARERAEETAARIEALQRTTRQLAQASTIAEIAEIATRDGAAALGATSAVVYVPDRDDPSRLSMAGVFGYVESSIAGFATLSIDEPLPVPTAFREREPVWTSYRSLPADPRLADVRAATDRVGLVAVPLIVEDRAVGVLGLGFGTDDAFGHADREVILAQANMVAQAIDRVRLTEAREGLLADLEAQRNRLETVLRQMPAGVLIADSSGRLVLANAQGGEIWRAPIPTERFIHEYPEYEARTLDGRPVAPDEWPLARALSLGETVTQQRFEITRFDGTQGWIDIDAAPIRDRDGAIVAAVSTFSDVTSQHLETSRQTFLAEASEVLASSLDYEETLARVMELAVPSIADWAAVDLLGENGGLDRLLVHHADPARIELARSYRERFPPDLEAETGLGAILRGGKPELVSDVPQAAIDAIPSEEQRQLVQELGLRSYMAIPLIAGGQTLGVMSFLGAESGRRFDADDLRLAEALAARASAAIQNARLFRDVARFKAILDATLDAVFMFDPDGLAIQYVNQGAIDQLGWQRDDLLAMGARDLSPELDDRRIRALVAPLLERRMGSRTVPIALRRRDGQLVPVEVLLQYVEPPGERGRIVAIARDISDRVEAQARLQRLAEAEHARAAELNAVIRAMGEGVVVCDGTGQVVLANPAAEELFPGVARGTFGDVLAQLEDPDDEAPVLRERGGLDEETRRSIFEDIHIEAERLHRLVEDVIALRRFGEEDDTEVGREPVLLQRILPAVLRSEEARWPGVSFELTVPSGTPTVVADPTYVEQVVRNLLSNAAKYGGPGSEVQAHVKATADEVVVRILDNGPGFPAGESDRLFDLFFRSPSTAGAASGAGIGLFVCARLIRAMGGRIWAQPRPEGGAEFGFALQTMDEESA